MKKWLKILKGSVGSNSVEIGAEIDDLKNRLEGKKKDKKRLEVQLKTARIDNLGGVDNLNDINSLEIEFLKSKSEISVLEEAIEALFLIQNESLENEKLEKIETLDTEITNLESEKAQIKEKFLKLAGEAAGLWCLLGMPSTAYQAGKKTYPWPMEKKETTSYDAAFQKSNEGKPPIRQIIYDLRLKRKAVIESLPLEKRKSYKKGIIAPV